MVRLLGYRPPAGRYWIYGFGLDGSLAQDVLVGRSRFLSPSWTRSYGRLNGYLAGAEGGIGDGFLVAQKRAQAVWIALGYLGWDRQLVIGSSALNEVIEGFDPPRNWLVLYRRDIVWLKGLRAGDRKTRRARELEFEGLLRRAREERERNEAINASMLARKRAVLARGEWRKKVTGNLQAIQATLKLDRILEPILGVKLVSRLKALERRVALLEGKGKWRMPTQEELEKLPWPARQLLERVAQEE